MQWRDVSMPVLAVALGIAGAVAAVPIRFGVNDGKVIPSWQNALASENSGSGSSDNGGSGSSGDDSNGDASSGSSGTSSGGTEDGDLAASSDRSRDEPGRRGIGTHDGRGVAHAQFTTRFDRRLPANRVSVVKDPHQAVSFYTEIVGMQGQTVTHRWSYDGEVVYQASSMINGSKWRFWSTQILPADKSGTWRVDVLDDTNTVLRSYRLEYRPAG